LLLSLNANNQILLWDCSQVTTTGTESSNGSGTIKHRFEYTSGKNSLEEDSATCMTWLMTQQNQFVVGYDTGHIVFFDIMSGSLASA